MESLPTAAPTTSPTLVPTAVPPSPTPEAGPIPAGIPADPAALEQAAPALPAVQPDLAGFAASITNGQVDTVVGIYIDGLFSLPVLQQPPGDDAYVSNDNHAVTQYAWPSKYGTIALLAHNTLSGRIFFQINANQDIILIFGDGRMEHYRMKEVQNYQALSPYDTHSDFVDLNGPGPTILTHEELFQRIYTTPGQLVLQTCFEANGDPSWGRMFVVAEPIK